MVVRVESSSGLASSHISFKRGPKNVSQSWILIVHQSQSHSHAHRKNLDVWALDTLSELSKDEIQVLVVTVAAIFAQGASGVYHIVAERTSANDRGEELPSVQPQEIANVSMIAFKELLVAHTPRLAKRMSPTEIHRVAQDFAVLRRAFVDEDSLRVALEHNANVISSFKDAWTPTGSRFLNLQNFCGGLASIFPNTATVESDFSIIGWKRDAHRLGITNFSLEGVMQCKQYEQLKQLSDALNAW